MRRAFPVLVLVLLTGVLKAGSSPSSIGPQADAPVAVHAQVREAVAGILLSRYVFPDIARRYAALLREPAASDRFDRQTSRVFARALTEALQGESRDGHLQVLPPDHPRAVDVHRGVVGMAGTADGARERQTRERRSNYYFTGVQLLEGNVGYIDFDQFPVMTPEARRAAEAAMVLVAHTDAVIIDLRANPGGSDGMNQFLSSHFLPEAPVVITSREYRQGEGIRRTDYPNDPALGGGRLSHVPLYILVDASTGSAAENMSFSLQGLGRAVIVGEATAGAAHSSQFHPLPHGFAIQIPIARSFNPRTGRDWEGVGVVPDVPTASADALTAHALALDRLEPSATDPAIRREIDDVRLRLRAPPAPPTETLRAHAGVYGDRYSVAFDEVLGHLTIVRLDRPRVSRVLRYLGDDRWVLGDRGFSHVRFQRDGSGNIVALQLREAATGVWQVPALSRQSR